MMKLTFVAVFILMLGCKSKSRNTGLKDVYADSERHHFSVQSMVGKEGKQDLICWSVCKVGDSSDSPCIDMGYLSPDELVKLSQSDNEQIRKISVEALAPRDHNYSDNSIKGAAFRSFLKAFQQDGGAACRGVVRDFTPPEVNSTQLENSLEEQRSYVQLENPLGYDMLATYTIIIWDNSNRKWTSLVRTVTLKSHMKPTMIYAGRDEPQLIKEITISAVSTSGPQSWGPYTFTFPEYTGDYKTRLITIGNADSATVDQGQGNDGSDATLGGGRSELDCGSRRFAAVGYNVYGLIKKACGNSFEEALTPVLGNNCPGCAYRTQIGGCIAVQEACNDGGVCRTSAAALGYDQGGTPSDIRDTRDEVLQLTHLAGWARTFYKVSLCTAK